MTNLIRVERKIVVRDASEPVSMARSGKEWFKQKPLPANSLVRRPCYRTMRFCQCILLAIVTLGSGCNNQSGNNESMPTVAGTDAESGQQKSSLPTQTVYDAKQAYNRGDNKLAQEIARQILVRDPDNLDANLVVVALAVRRSEPTSAAEMLMQLAETHPEKKIFLQAQAAGLFDQGGDWQRAIEIMAQIVQRHPDQMDMRRSLAGLLNSRGFRFDANEHLRFLAGRISLTPRELIALINPLLTWESFPSKPDINDTELVARSGTLNVVAALRANGDVRDALNLLDKSELLRSGHPAAIAMRGWLLSLNQDFEALTSWAAGTNNDCQRYPAYWLGLGNLMLHLQKPSAVQ
ncbi:MAG: hypothetical protein KDB00_07480 [Planctomycetales bacterium]|nr:hypothetical protein [Planctomycetales bacterium]